MELATALVWTLRIVLPIVLFCIYFKLQSPKEEQDTGPTSNVIPRHRLLCHRKAQAVVGAPAPGPVENITLKDPIQAPALFTGAGGRGSRGGRRDDARGPGRERREKRGGDVRKAQPEPQETAVDVEGAGAAPGSEDKMHLESLLNYVAFNRAEQKRTFLPDESGAPPPPPPPSKKPKEREPEPSISAEASEKANGEAQMVLRGAIDFKRPDVAKHLYEQLCEAQVEVSESSFELMIEACIYGQDLKGSSDFLMKMESAGYLPSSSLLDKVMELYSRHKVHRERGKTAQAEAMMPDVVIPFAAAEAVGEMVDEGLRTRLSSSAPVFVPSFIPPPPPPPPGEGAAAEAGEDSSLQRSKLTADAKPFEPKFNVTFDPYMCNWTVEQTEEWGKGPGGKGKEKGKAKGKGKGDAKTHQEKQRSSSAEPAKSEKTDGNWSWKEKEGKKPVVKVWKPKAVSAEAV